MSDTKQPLAEEVELWTKYLAVAEDFRKMRRELRRRSCDRSEVIVELLRRSLSIPEEKDVALDFVPALTLGAQQELFDVLLPLAADLDIGSVNRAEQIILSFPRDWLVEKLEDAARMFLDGERDISAEIMGLYFQADKALARRLAEKAKSSADASRRDLGEFFLKKLNQQETQAKDV